MISSIVTEIRKDCLNSSLIYKDTLSQLTLQKIVVTGGTGFMGTWLAEMVATLNDEYHLGIKLQLLSRNTTSWKSKCKHLANRDDIELITQDVRSKFSINQVNYVINAAGIPNNIVHSLDPLRVFETTVQGTLNILEAVKEADGLKKILNISSGLVDSKYLKANTDRTETQHLYSEAKRTSELIANVYRSKSRLHIATVRPYTFIGPYQPIDSPWALNNFIRDLVVGNQIRIHGNGSAIRSYLYGSDLAAWILVSLVKAVDGEVYDFGGNQPVNHLDLANIVRAIKDNSNSDIEKHNLLVQNSNDIFLPDLSRNIDLGLVQYFDLKKSIEKTFEWIKGEKQYSRTEKSKVIEYNPYAWA